jgi:hypothetical protein
MFEIMKKLKRIDPPDCGCTDCIIGYSKPINHCSCDELMLLHLELLQNASGLKTTVKIEICYT